MAKGVAHAGRGKSLSSGEARENERRGWTEESYRRKNESQFNNYDWSRHNLNFEIANGQIMPLGKQKVSLYNRYHNILKGLDFSQYKDGATNQQHTYVELILSGSTEKMQKIAFGDQNVDYTRNPERWQNWDVKRTTGKGSIEEWALDVYNFACAKYGKENIVGFEVHLDETEPHVHCNIVPTAVMKQRGNVSGYHKIEMEMKEGKMVPKLDGDGNTIPATYKKGKHVGEVVKISDKKYDVLSDDKKQEYRKNERGTVWTVSYATFFGGKLEERSQKLSELHDDFYEQVGKKWGFERGDVIALLPPEERAKRKHLTKAQRWKLNQGEKVLDEVDKKVTEQNNTIKSQTTTIASYNALIKMRSEKLAQQNNELQIIRENTEQAKEEERKYVDAKNVAVKEFHEQENAKAENKRIIEQQRQTITEQQSDIIHNVNALDNVQRDFDGLKEKVKMRESELNGVEENIQTARKNLADIQTKKEVIQGDVDILAKVNGLVSERVDAYIQSLPDVSMVITDEIRKMLVSPIKDHPRTTSPMPLKELQRVVEEELEKIIMDKGSVWKPVTKEERNERMKAVMTDMTTILIQTVGLKQKKDIARAQGDLYKAVRREAAKAASDTVKIRELEREGVNDVSQVKELKETAERTKATEDMLEFAWPGVTKAKNILTDSALDKNYMTAEQKKSVLGVLRNDPEQRLDDIMRLLKYACSFRDIPVATRAEAIESSVEGIIKSIAKSGYDLVKEATPYVSSFAKDLEMTVAEAAESTASAAVCLIFGYLDAATTVSEGCGGGGGNNDLPKKKDDEDLKSFYGRCLGAAVRMMRPSRQIKVGRR